ncbi:MAG: hypothetical protein IMZ69_08325 [Spirochaetes bacterium]|nr:hypothetical protein [Spirochaetota bacterium]
MMPRIGAEGEQRVGDGLEEDLVEAGLVREDDRVEVVWQGEDGVEVVDRQEFGLSGLEPLGLGDGLALGAMAISAGVVGGAFEAAVGAAFEMPTQGSGATPFDRVHDAEGWRGQAVGLAVGVSVQPKDVGDFMPGPLPGRRGGADLAGRHQSHEDTVAETGNGTRRGQSGGRRSQRASGRGVGCREKGPRKAGSFNAAYRQRQIRSAVVPLDWQRLDGSRDADSVQHAAEAVLQEGRTFAPGR